MELGGTNCGIRTKLGRNLGANGRDLESSIRKHIEMELANKLLEKLGKELKGKSGIK